MITMCCFIWWWWSNSIACTRIKWWWICCIILLMWRKHCWTFSSWKKVYGKYRNKYQTQTPTVNRLWMKLWRWIYRIETKIHPTITDAIQIMTYRNQYLRMSVCAFELIEERHWIFLILWQMMMTMTNVGLCKFFFLFFYIYKNKIWITNMYDDDHRRNNK